jgi:uncharacterized protein (DUF1697 family)
MNQFVAFLRGINVGGRTIKMVDLEDCFQKTGFSSVRTVLQSGNVIFASSAGNPAAIKQKIEAALTKRFAYPAKVQVIGIKALQKIVADYPFNDNEPDFQHYVVFLEGEKAQQLSEEIKSLKSRRHAQAR